MLRIIQFSRQVGATLLRQKLKDEGCIQTTHRHSTPQFYFDFDGSLRCPQVFKELCTELIERQAHTPELVGARNPCSLSPCLGSSDQYQGGQHNYETHNLLQALQYGLVVAISYSLIHDTHWFKEKLLCPVLKIKENKSFQAQPLEATDISIIHEEVKEAKNVDDPSSFDFKLLDKDLLNTNSSVSTTSDYSSQAEKSHVEDVDSVTNLILDLQRSIPMELQILEVVEELKTGSTKAIQSLRNFAHGSSSAVFYLALAYEYGVSVEQDSGEALRLYTQAASMGHQEAKFNLGVLKVENEEMEEGLQLIKEAADNGVIEALHALENYPE